MGSVVQPLSYALAPVTGGASLLVPGAAGIKKLGASPNPPAVRPSPSVATQAVQQAAADAARRRSRARGFQSTILSQNFLDPSSPAMKETFGG